MAVVHNGIPILVIELAGCICAIPLSHVIETMRPLPVVPISSTLPFVRGMAVIRGIPTPVLDLGKLVGTPDEPARRFVTLRLGQRQVVLSVREVLGIIEMDPTTMMDMPSLLVGSSDNVIEAVGACDTQALVVLRSGWQLPDEVWHAMAAQETA